VMPRLSFALGVLKLESGHGYVIIPFYTSPAIWKFDLPNIHTLHFFHDIILIHLL
jgi:hypothetical protein